MFGGYGGDGSKLTHHAATAADDDVVVAVDGRGRLDTEQLAVRKAVAASEAEWKGVGLEAGVRVWRIDDFSVLPQLPSMYGTFYEGDSYIVLHTLEEEGKSKLTHHIYFWLGKDSTIDERGTAAFKTVELDDLLDQHPIQHRESQKDGESAEFKAIFPGGIKYKEGECSASAFRHVSKDVHENKLFIVRQVKREMQCYRIPLKTSALNPGDCFILDGEKDIYILNGPSSSPKEKFEASLHAERFESERKGLARTTHDIDDAFWNALEGDKPSWAVDL